MKPLKTRLLNYTDKSGVKVKHIADKCDVDPNVLYRLRGGAQETLGESDAIKLHEYLKQFETEEK